MDPYHILGVAKDADDDQIKKAYRKLSKQYHPDLNKDNPDATEKFKEVNAAYEILSDKQKRAQYDQFGSAAFGGGAGGGGFGGFDFNGFQGGFQGGAGGFADIFESFFGGAAGGGRRQRSYRGQDLEVRLTVDFNDAIFGADKTISLNKEVTCGNCEGKGHEKDAKITDCETCKGTGEVSAIKNTILGQIRTSAVCTTCSGEGKTSDKPCASCHSSGVVRSKEEVTVRIPAGVSDGTTLRLSGKGGAGMKGHEAGDLYVQIHVKPSQDFERKGENIYSSQKIHFLQAVLGDEIEVHTVHGPVRMQIDAGTQPGQTLRIKGKGAPRLNTSVTGDHFVTLEVEIPKKLMNKEKEHYEELAKIAKLSTKSKDKSFFSKLFS